MIDENDIISHLKLYKYVEILEFNSYCINFEVLEVINKYKYLRCLNIAEMNYLGNISDDTLKQLETLTINNSQYLNIIDNIQMPNLGELYVYKLENAKINYGIFPN